MSQTETPWIEVFTVPACLDCRALKVWLNANSIPFVERDLRDPTIVEEAKRRTGARVAPLTIAAGEVLYGPYPGQRNRLTAMLGLDAAA